MGFREFSDRNNAILSSVHMLINYFKIPALLISDFNIEINEFISSAWPDRLGLSVLNPKITPFEKVGFLGPETPTFSSGVPRAKIPSTTSQSSSRVIDFVLVSPCLCSFVV